MIKARGVLAIFAGMVGVMASVVTMFIGGLGAAYSIRFSW
jgi:hypothetical protein